MNAVERGVRRLDGFQQRHVTLSFVVGVVKKFGDDNAGRLAVQVAYALFVSVFPLLLLLVTVSGIVLADNPGERARLLHSALGQFPIVGQQLGENIHAIKRGSAFGFVVGIAGLTYGSMALARSAQFCMEQIWNIPVVERPHYVTRLLRAMAFLGELALALVITTTLAGFGTLARHHGWQVALGEALAVLVNALFYFAAFRTLTPRQVSTRSLLPGVLAGAVAWTMLQAAGGYVVGHYLKGASSLYGFFGLVRGLIAWIFLGAQIALYAAEVNAVLHHRLWPRGIVQPPLTDADQRSLALHVTQSRRRPEQEVHVSFRERPMTQDEFRARGYVLDDSTRGIERHSPQKPDD